MDAVIVDHKDNSFSFPYLDWAWDPRCTKDPDRFGHIRAQKVADIENEREAGERFRVWILVPKIGAPVKVKAYRAIRNGKVIDVRCRAGRTEVRVLWHNAKGEPHDHWYDTRELRGAGTRPANWPPAIPYLKEEGKP